MYLSRRDDDFMLIYNSINLHMQSPSATIWHLIISQPEVETALFAC